MAPPWFPGALVQRRDQHRHHTAHQPATHPPNRGGNTLLSGPTNTDVALTEERTSPPVIVVDAMGGDNAPAEIVRGAVIATREFDLRVVLVGRRTEIARILAEEEAFGKSPSCTPRTNWRCTRGPWPAGEGHAPVPPWLADSSAAGTRTPSCRPGPPAGSWPRPQYGCAPNRVFYARRWRSPCPPVTSPRSWWTPVPTPTPNRRCWCSSRTWAVPTSRPPTVCTPLA